MMIVYFVHDLNDPAVHRRVRMLHAAGADVGLLGFYRGQPPLDVDGVVPLTLGRTADAQLWQRAIAVLGAALRTPLWKTMFARADLILARQLEALVLAALARALHTRTTPLIFECLDIHRQMGSRGLAGQLLRIVERRLLSQCQGLIVSSPAFVAAHFEPVHRRLPAVTVIENKALSFEFDRGLSLTSQQVRRLPGPPWRIGWFGIIRCATSLRILRELALTFPGKVEIIIRGRVARSVLPHFDTLVAETPGLSFGGSYDRGRDLPALYGAVHFAWAIDFYEAGSNSAWLLPNRLYEAGLFGAVPIACGDVATGAWLAARGIGVLLAGEPSKAITSFIRQLDSRRYDAMLAGLTAVPKAAFLYDRDDCRTLISSLVSAG